MPQKYKISLSSPNLLSLHIDPSMRFARLISLLTALCLLAPAARAARPDPYTAYIETYAEMAREQERLHGIPASITLAQGLLESRAGQSTLATEGNNHFGIKCHSSWTGPSMLRSDDMPDECFRVYGSAAECFTDHSLFLHKNRYKPLFDLDPTDYAAWAVTLRQCGYATDPNYAERLISIIERYSLFRFDLGYEPARTMDENTDFILDHLRNSHAVRRTRSLHYVIAIPGDTYASIAREFNLDADRLAAYNDASDPQAPIRSWEEVYLQPKLDSAPKGVSKVTVGDDESIRSVAQRYAVTVEYVMHCNPGAKDRPGTTLKFF